MQMVTEQIGTDTTQGKIAQFNMNACKVAHNMFKQRLTEWGVDVALVAEPHVKKSYGRWMIHPNGTTGIWVKRPGLVEEVIFYQEGPEGMTGVQVSGCLYVSVYFSPNNHSRLNYDAYLDRLAHIVRSRKKVIIGGDLNAKSRQWESPVINWRAAPTERLIDTCGLRVQNVGNVATCVRTNGESIVDVTLTTENIPTDGWKVHDDLASYSDHRYITYCVKMATDRRSEVKEDGIVESRGWILNDDQVKAFESALKTNFQISDDGDSGSSSADVDAETMAIKFQETITNTCNDVLKKRKPPGVRTAVYWWNNDIAKTRDNCDKLRRKLKKTPMDAGNADRRTSLLAQLKEERKQLRRAISKSKEDKWNELLKGLNPDPWSKGYKIAMGRLAERKPAPELANPDAVIKELFPDDDEPWETTTSIEDVLFEDTTEPVPFTPEELAVAVDKVKFKKAPGPDKISGEVVRACFRAVPNSMLALYNRCLSERVFPSIWKTGRLVLIPKPNSTKYRPLTMLPELGKVYERLINARLKTMVDGTDKYLSDKQYGFRAGRSTKDALERLKNAITEARKKRMYCMVVCLDIKNAFNTVKWSAILAKLRNAGVPKYMWELVKSYGSGRIITYESEGRTWRYRINRGVPQGSVLGPTLWNVAYNDVLTCNGEDNESETIGFADDTLYTATGIWTDELETKANGAIRKIQNEVERIGCEFAAQKTTAMLAGPARGRRSLKIFVVDTEVEFGDSVKYLGIIVDTRCSFQDHVDYAVGKTKKVMGKLSGIMKNLKGPSEKTRRLYSTVAMQVLMYGAPIWAGKLTATQKKKINAIQREINIRQIQGYISVGADTACVLSGNPPADLIAEEYVRVANRLKRPPGTDPITQIEKKCLKKDERARTIDSWQTRWNEQGNWLSQICSSVTAINRNIYRATFHTTQILSGKGVFGSYRAALKKVATAQCWYCSEEDDPAHTLFVCSEWAELRAKFMREIPDFRKHSDLLKQLTDSEATWNAFSMLSKNIMATKEGEERTREQAKREEEQRARPRCSIM